MTVLLLREAALRLAELSAWKEDRARDELLKGLKSGIAKAFAGCFWQRVNGNLQVSTNGALSEDDWQNSRVSWDDDSIFARDLVLPPGVYNPPARSKTAIFIRAEHICIWNGEVALPELAAVSVPPAKPKSGAGRTPMDIWEEVLIEAARYVFQNSGKTCPVGPVLDHLETFFGDRCPGRTALRSHVTPLVTRMIAD